MRLTCKASTSHETVRKALAGVAFSCCAMAAPASAQTISAEAGMQSLRGDVSTINPNANLARYLTLLEHRIFGLGFEQPSVTQLELVMPHARSRAHALMVGMVDMQENRTDFSTLEIDVAGNMPDDARGNAAGRGNIRYRLGSVTDTLGIRYATGMNLTPGRAGITLVKRLDSLLFFAGVNRSIQASRTINGLPVHAGNPAGLKLGSVMTLGPASSLRMDIEFRRMTDIRDANGVRVQDMGPVGVRLSGAYSWRLPSHVSLGVEAGIALDSHVPNIRLIAAIPLHF